MCVTHNRKETPIGGTLKRRVNNRLANRQVVTKSLGGSISTTFRIDERGFLIIFYRDVKFRGVTPVVTKGAE
jgi:hypothetical protein